MTGATEGREALFRHVRVELDEEAVRQWYADYCSDVTYYRDHGDLDPDHPDQGYATGVPYSWEEYAVSVLDGCLEDILGTYIGYRASVVTDE